MAKLSAGLLMYRFRAGQLEVLLGHPGGPFFTNKDLGAWTIPKGLVDEAEDQLAAARREFEEETGTRPEGRFVPLGEVLQKGGKTVIAWAFEGDLDPAAIRSNTFQREWPPRSGRWQTFPEIDRAAFFSIDEARGKINPAQAEFLSRLERLLP
ncbi:MAG TPA: NUDIX domain-containing protein [Gemmatimonadaceae bacterium]|jgi:predicted NUDIX family NTP pyrophosphohydrolase